MPPPQKKKKKKKKIHKYAEHRFQPLVFWTLSMNDSQDANYFGVLKFFFILLNCISYKNNLLKGMHNTCMTKGELSKELWYELCMLVVL